MLFIQHTLGKDFCDADQRQRKIGLSGRQATSRVACGVVTQLQVSNKPLCGLHRGQEKFFSLQASQRIYFFGLDNPTHPCAPENCCFAISYKLGYNFPRLAYFIKLERVLFATSYHRSTIGIAKY